MVNGSDGSKVQENIPNEWKGNADDAPLNPVAGDPTPGGSGVHSMVMIGAYEEIKMDVITEKEQSHWYFMLLNSWPHMPLLLVSPAYLMACKARVFFLLDRIDCKPTDDLDRNNKLMGESSFLDGGDDASEASLNFFKDDFDDDNVE